MSDEDFRIAGGIRDISMATGKPPGDVIWCLWASGVIDTDQSGRLNEHFALNPVSQS